MSDFIYLVEDDKDIRDLVVYALKNEGYDVLAFSDGREIFLNLEKKMPSVLILDIMLPYENGLEILKKIRKQYKFLPVIMLTAKSLEYDKILGLDLGADDYITKPFSIIEFLARVRAILRRCKKDVETVITFKNIKLYIDKHLVFVDDKEIFLTVKEFELLNYLIKNKNKVITREMILNSIWGYEFEGESRTIDVHIANLRQKLGKYGKCLKTVRGVGYKVGDEF